MSDVALTDAEFDAIETARGAENLCSVCEYTDAPASLRCFSCTTDNNNFKQKMP